MLNPRAVRTDVRGVTVVEQTRPAAYRFSVVLPTYNRRAVVTHSLHALAAVAAPWPCELIVVVDGSDDGTAEAVAGMAMPFPLRVLVQAHAGAAAARNAGAAAASGAYLLF